MMTASKKKRLKGRSVRTISQAMSEPSRMEKNDVHAAMTSELSSGT